MRLNELEQKFSKEFLEKILKDCISIAQLIRKLNIKNTGDNFTYLKKLIKIYEIDWDNYKGRYAQQGIPKTEEHKKKISIKVKEVMWIPEIRQKFLKATKEAHLNPEYKKKRSEISKKVMSDANIIKKISEKLKGRKLTAEHIINIKNAINTPEIKEKIHNEKCIFHKNNSNLKKDKTNEEYYGVEKAKEISKKISYTLSKYFDNNKHPQKGKTFEEMYGVERAKELKRKSSEMMIVKLKNNDIYKNGFREDLNKYFRSKFEANYARFLNYMDIKWEFETDKCVFKLNNGRRYVCDFYLPETDEYIELKGYMRKDAEEKLNMFKKEYPDIKFKILFFKSKEWKDIVDMCCLNIVNWEHDKNYKYIGRYGYEENKIDI
jgi:hypothetical protein